MSIECRVIDTNGDTDLSRTIAQAIYDQFNLFAKVDAGVVWAYLQDPSTEDVVRAYAIGFRKGFKSRYTG